MKLTKTLVVLASVLTTNLISLSVEAQPSCTSMNPRPYVEPGTLASMAINGAFKDQGIPASTQLRNEFKSGWLTAPFNELKQTGRME